MVGGLHVSQDDKNSLRRPQLELRMATELERSNRPFWRLHAILQSHLVRRRISIMDLSLSILGCCSSSDLEERRQWPNIPYVEKMSMVFHRIQLVKFVYDESSSVQFVIYHLGSVIPNL